MEDMERIRQLVGDGMSAAKIALLCNLERKKVQKIIEENNYDLIKEDFNDSKIKHICELYESGVSARQLAIKYSIDKRRIQKWADQNGQLRSKDDSHRLTNINFNALDVIQSEDQAYWLGFLYAEAYNSDFTGTVNVTLKGIYEDQLYKLADFFGLEKSKVERKPTNEGYDYVSVRMYSKHLCTKLTELGCPRAKTFIIKYPDWLDEKLNNHFIRGMVDGDGEITITNKECIFYLSSTEDCLKSIINIFEKEFGFVLNINSFKNKDSYRYSIETNDNNKISMILNWIYKDSTNKNRMNNNFEKFNEFLKL